MFLTNSRCGAAGLPTTVCIHHKGGSGHVFDQSVRRWHLRVLLSGSLKTALWQAARGPSYLSFANLQQAQQNTDIVFYNMKTNCK